MKQNAFITKLRHFLTHPRKVYAILPAMTVYALWRMIDSYTSLINAPSRLSSTAHVALAISTTLFAFLVTFIFSKIAQNASKSFWLLQYMLAMAVSVLPILIFWVSTFQVPFISIVVLYCRLILLVSVTESIPGYLISQIKVRAYELELHQKSLVESEENFRKNVSVHLHDNLQTRLVMVGIQLDQLRDQTNAKQSDKITAVIDEIEKIRSHDVRDFGRGISPQIQVDGLVESLRRLFGQYDNVITCTLSGFDSEHTHGKFDPTVELGIYRIVEQALLNALMHGQASTLDVRVSSDGGDSQLEIANNGLIFNVHGAQQGHGFAVIDSWVSKLDGAWRIFNNFGVTTIHVSWSNPISQM